MTAPNFKAGAHVKVQRSGVAAGSAATIDAASSPAPTVGSRLVLRVGVYSRQGSTFTITDNQASGGNSWSIDALSLFTVDANNKVIAAICSCEVTQTVSSPFTISVNVTSPGGTTFHALVLDEIEGFNATTFLEAAGSNSSGTSNSAVGALPDTTNDCLKLGVATWYGGADGSNGSGWTLDDGYTSNAIQAATCVSKSLTAADTTDPTISLTASDQWAAASVAIRGISAAVLALGSDVASRRNRPGHGPYSHARYFRPALVAFTYQAGGQSYDVTIAETGTAADSLSAQLSAVASLAEAASAADAISAALSAAAGVAETASATDSVSGPATFQRSVGTESASAADSLSSTVGGYDVTIAETAAAADSLSALLNAAVTLAETGSAADTVSSLATLLAALTESVSASDVVSTGGATYGVDFTEAASAAESLSAQAEWSRSVTESGSAADTQSAQVAFAAALAEAVAALDVVSAQGILGVTITETAAAADSVSAPTGFGEVPPERVITIRFEDRTVRIVQTRRPIKVLN